MSLQFPPLRVRRRIVIWLGAAGALASIWAVFRAPAPPSLEPRQIDTLANIEQTHKLKIGYISYFEMTARRADTGQLAGFLIDVLQEITTALHLRSEDLEFHETDWQSFAFGLQEGKFDLSIGGTFQTPARLCLVAFTRPLGHLGNGALVRSQDERFAAARDIFSFNRANLTLAVVMGEQGSEYAHKNLTLSKFRDLPGSDLTQPCLEVAGGRADAALSDQYILRRCVDSQPGVLKDVLSDRPYLVLPISWAVRKSDKRWLDFLDAQIAVLDQSGWLQRRRESYVSIPWANSANASPVIPGSCGLPLSIYGSAFLTGLG